MSPTQPAAPILFPVAPHPDQQSSQEKVLAWEGLVPEQQFPISLVVSRCPGLQYPEAPCCLEFWELKANISGRLWEGQGWRLPTGGACFEGSCVLLLWTGLDRLGGGRLSSHSVIRRAWPHSPLAGHGP